MRFDAALPGDRPAGSFRAVAAADGATADSDRPDARLPAALTAAVEERTLGLTRAERAAQSAILERLAGFDPAALADLAEPVAFPALMAEPGFYRGKPVTLTGTARGVRDLPGREGQVGTADVWFFPPDAGNNPVRAVVNDAPGLPRGERLAEGVPVSVTGYFFKLQGYEAESGLRAAPLILANAAVRVTPAATVPGTPPALPWVVLGAIAVACGAGGWLVWRWRAGDAAFERSTLRRVTTAARESPDLPPTAADDPAAFLAGLAAADRPSDR